MDTRLLHRYPFLRLLLLLAAGIWLGDYLFFEGQVLPVAFLFSLLGLLSVALFFSAFGKRYSLRWVFGCLLLGVGVAGGVTCMQVHLQRAVAAFPEQDTVCRVLLTGKPEPTERTLRCRGELQSSHTVLLYLPNDSLSRQLRRGDELLVSARFSLPANNGNPDEFDYARYLQRKGIRGTAFVQSGRWKQVAYHPPTSFRSRALAYREKILEMYHRLGFEGETFAVLAALTVGYTDDLEEGLLESYSISGASHVLSLSGLHIGFLYALLFALLRLLPGEENRTRWVRAGVIVLVLWYFAFFTGLSPAVVRSVCMFSLFGVSYALGRRSFTLNSLFASAFFMLLCVPEWLFDVGFQLSFVGVAAILVWQPVIYRWVPVSSRPARYVWGVMSLSLAAQLGTAPLVVLYFFRFSNHFLLTNLLVVPLASLILYAAIGMLLLSPFPLLQGWAVVAVRGLIDALNAFVRWVEQLPFASVDGLWLYPLEVGGIYLVALLAFWFLKRWSIRSLLACLSVTFLLILFHAVKLQQDDPPASLEFYNVRNCPAVHCLAGDAHSWVVYADSVPDEERLRKALLPHWNRLRLDLPRKVTGDYRSDILSVRNHLIAFCGTKVGVLNDNRWQNKTVSQPLLIDYLYVCKGFTGSLQTVARLFRTKRVVLDASLPVYRRENLKRQCRRLGIGFVALSEQGSVRFLL